MNKKVAIIGAIIAIIAAVVLSVVLGIPVATVTGIVAAVYALTLLVISAFKKGNDKLPKWVKIALFIALIVGVVLAAVGGIAEATMVSWIGTAVTLATAIIAFIVSIISSNKEAKK